MQDDEWDQITGQRAKGIGRADGGETLSTAADLGINESQ